MLAKITLAAKGARIGTLVLMPQFVLPLSKKVLAVKTSVIRSMVERTNLDTKNLATRIKCFSLGLLKKPFLFESYSIK